MDTQHTSLKTGKRTKIIATVGPATNSYEAILGLIKAGADGLRLNFSHGTNEERDVQIEWIRKASEELLKPVAIIQDLQGPKIRLGSFEGTIEVKTGDELTLQYGVEYVAGGPVPVQYDISTKIKIGERLYLFDGKIRTTVTSVGEGVVKASVENDGVLMQKKGLNLPDTDFGGDIITPKDIADYTYGASKDIDYVALSFVQRAEDIRNLRKALKSLGSTAKVIAKIETPAAVENIEEIIKEVDVVMVARGDLAVETPAESVPVVQREIIALGLKCAKPTIVATQMLASMTESPEPTRAEVSDVATAVFLGADCVMLSDETANGKYPLAAVEIMSRTAAYAEAHSHLATNQSSGRCNPVTKAIAGLAEDLKAAAIVVEARTSETLLEIASLRPGVPLITLAGNARTAQQAAIVNGAVSYVRPSDATGPVTEWLSVHTPLISGSKVIIASAHATHDSELPDSIQIATL